ncbi:NADP-dependent oxidoreductase [Glaciibacter sp. 2TAF33]|uniref:NADP-dependent oxidoreductase n=1 Tax=Glaciibacter sp. 2TAF33 TaxID=3233015 RepID=UPI003F93A89D
MAVTWVANDFGGLDVFELVEADVPEPGPGQVTIQVRAAGMNPTDFKSVARGTDRSRLPFPVGSEIAGVISALGPDTRIASGGGAVGDEVLAYRVSGGYASALTVPAKNVFAKPASLGFPEAANLLLVGATAAEMLDVVRAESGDTILLHGASGSVGTSVLQQARLAGVRVVGTASPANFEVVRRFGGTPVAYGDGLLVRVREATPGGVVAALDTVGTDEAVEVSLALVADRNRIVSIAAFGRAESEGYRVIGGAMPASAAFRDRVRPHLIDLAGRGDLVVPVVRTFRLEQAREALEILSRQHPGGKFALIPD